MREEGSGADGEEDEEKKTRRSDLSGGKTEEWMKEED